jgi:putative DNA primase/helicase
LVEHGMRVAVARPPNGVKDFNDIVKAANGPDLAAAYASVRAAIEGAQDVRKDAPDASMRWGDAEREILAKLALGDSAAFLARAKSDPGFPFEPEAIAALNTFAKGRPADWQRLSAQLKTDPKIHLSALEAMMKAEAGNGDGGDDGLPGRPIAFDEIEPWDEAVNGAQLLSELSDAIGAYIVMDRHQCDATALWAAFAHAHDLCDYAPPLVIKSPVKRCGKTKLQETLALLAPRPQPTSGITAAAFSRIIEKHHPTLLIDEYDAQTAGDKDMAESLRGQLNSSFNKRGAVVLKSVSLPGGGWETRQFSTWAPTCVAGIGKMSDTVEDRSVIIRLERKLRDVKVKRLRGKDGGELIVLARKLARFVSDNELAIRSAEPDVPATLNDRQQDAWTPLLTLAELAGGGWPQRARAAAKALCRVDAEEDAELDVKTVLLADIHDIFARAYPPEDAAHKAGQVGRPDDGPRLLTRRLLDELIRLEERPWGAWGKARKPMTDMGLASVLRPYGVRSSTVRSEDAVGNVERGKGYFLRSFEDAFSRYLAISGLSGRAIVPNAGNAGENKVFEGVPMFNSSRVENPRNASKSVVWHDGTASKSENRRVAGEEVADDGEGGLV